MTVKTKVEGIKDDLDLKGIAQAFLIFKESISEIFVNCKTAHVDLDFDSSLNKTVHYTFKQDEPILSISDVVVNEDNKKIMFKVPAGAKDKVFYTNDAELITVVTEEGHRASLDSHIREQFNTAFAPELKINSVVALQAMCRNNPGLVPILNDPDKYLNEVEALGKRGKSYSTLVKFGIY